ncbi:MULTISPECIES: hypothetical protein [Streptomyces]|uniref:Secreted protein n=1 Tax=Streptomyces caniscabiei TaxID=2746961 RepID=A0ABU4MPB4_9ACTN|nr:MULTISPECIES: hypothetical protein [Streptomyces]MBE4738008.1 hypothetical protein [Streptomyces caniscabiei]MBE4757194.1 hypothetical protein [Streptomyces caniscabiei]MBE4769192.1 hypothetical protein [Streptomyces caniscabiei]MBE4785086.1 hypothetical protein [Streptomyces caniscabiei]MBE4795871.1 hypothetical protein [Streptomyces caniscabiei]
MIEVVIAVLGAVVGAAALVVSIAGHRHNVRQAGRLAERERRVEDREREADQREKLIQSSMLHVTMDSRPSVLADGYARWRLEAVNTSNQPLVQVAVHYDDVRLDGREILAAGGRLSVDLPMTSATGSPPSPLLCSVEFTDSSGSRWRRLATGRLQPWASGTGDETDWQPPVAPIVGPLPVPLLSGRPAGLPPEGAHSPRQATPPPAPPRPLSTPAYRAAVVAVIVIVVAAAYLLVRYMG